MPYRLIMGRSLFGVALVVLAGVGCSSTNGTRAGIDTSNGGRVETCDASVGDAPFGAACAEDSGCACASASDCPAGWACTKDTRGEITHSQCTRPTPEGRVDSSTDAGSTPDADSGRTGTMPQATVLRSLTLAPDSEVAGADVKVVLIVDNSPSMAEEQDRVATGLRSMMTRLRSQSNVELQFYVYSTTSLSLWPGTDPTFYRTRSFTWSDGTTHPQGPSTRSAYHEIEEFLLSAPHNGGSPLRFTRSMPQTAFDAGVDALVAAVRSLGVTGSDAESGLCSIGRTIVDDGPNAFLHRGDTVAFVLVSDADESEHDDYCSDHCPDYCPRREDTAVTPTTYNDRMLTTNPAEAIATLYDVDAFTFTFTYDITNPETGALSPKTSSRDVDPTQFGLPLTCPASPAPCAPGMMTGVPASFANARSCVYGCSPHYADIVGGAAYDPNADYCATPYTARGKTFSNVYEAVDATVTFAPGSCRGSGYYKNVVREAYQTATTTVPVSDLLAVRTRSGLADRLADSLPATFGPNNFFFSAIINDPRLPGASCSSSEAPAPGYASFARDLGAAGHVQSICDTDYSPSLAGLEAFASLHVQQEFAVTLAQGEAIGRVFLLRGGVETEVKGSDLRVFGNRIAITGTVTVQTGDQLRVEIIQG